MRIDQLKEVYGIDSLLYETVHSWFKIDLDKVEGICVDDTSEKELIRHPYLDYKQDSYLGSLSIMSLKIYPKSNLYHI